LRNNEPTFEEVLEEHSALIRKVCQFYADTEQDFEDNVQEVALQLWRSYPTFEGRSKLSTWIYRVALNVCLSQLRREKKRPQTTTLPPQVKSEHKNNHEYSERKNRLYKAIKELGELDRAIIIQYLDGFSYREIAEIMGISVSHVGVKIHRIKKELKQKING